MAEHFVSPIRPHPGANASAATPLKLALVAIVAPVLYGCACVPGNGLLATLFPDRLNPDGGTSDPFMVALFLGMHSVYAWLAGYSRDVSFGSAYAAT